MHVYESNNIRVSGYPLPLKLKIVDDLTIDNPAYVKAKYQRRPTWGIDQKLQLFTYDNDGNLEVYDKASNGFKVRNLGSAKSVSFTWTIINTNIQ